MDFETKILIVYAVVAALIPCLIQALLCVSFRSTVIRLVPTALAVPVYAAAVLDHFYIIDLSGESLTTMIHIDIWNLIFAGGWPVLLGILAGWIIGVHIKKGLTN